MLHGPVLQADVEDIAWSSRASRCGGCCMVQSCKQMWGILHGPVVQADVEDAAWSSPASRCGGWCIGEMPEPLYECFAVAEPGL